MSNKILYLIKLFLGDTYMNLESRGEGYTSSNGI